MIYHFQAPILARAFVNVMTDWLTPFEMEQVRTRNAEPFYEGVCATHDFCDANMAMLEAFTDVMGRSPLHDDAEMTDHDIAVWNRAWAIAHKHSLTDSMVRMLIDTHAFERWQTGGGCVALGKQCDGFHLLVTAGDGISYPTETDWMVGRYEDDADQESAIYCADQFADINDAIETLNPFPCRHCGEPLPVPPQSPDCPACGRDN